MLSELKLSNFRLFDDEVSVRFRPITVLIGRNSSGKSSALKFLLMLKQSSLSTGEDFPVVNGKFVHLGDFTDLRNVLSKKENLEFELSFFPPNFSEFVLENLDKNHRKGANELLVSMRGAIPFSGSPQSGRVTYRVAKPGSSAPYFDFAASMTDDNIFFLSALENNVGKTKRMLEEFISQYGSRKSDSYSEATVSLQEEIAKDEVGISFQKELISAHHLPPLRGELSRLVDFSETARESTERIMKDTLSQLRRIVREDSASYQFLSRHLLDVAAIESLDIRDDELERAEVFAKNRSTGAEVLIADLGFGVSQCLPILVKGASMTPGSYLMVEQPEAQLHPTAQLHLGSYFAELWTERKVGSIVETHSQNLLLRLRRLIARGSLKHQDVSVAFFTLGGDRENIPIVKNLNINEDGSMEPGLPMEFFAEDIREGLKLGLRE